MNSKSCPINFSIGENTPPNPQSNYFEHALNAIRRFAIFTGRATRKEYWSCAIALGVVVGIIDTILKSIQISVSKSYAEDAVLNGDLEFLQAYTEGTLTMFSFGFTAVALGLLRFLIIFACYVPVIAVLVRRSHDVGKSGKIGVITMAMMLFFQFCACFSAMTTLATTIVMISSLGSLYLLFFIVFRDSQKGDNQYGPSTKYPE